MDQQLAVFVAVVELRGFSRAAEHLHLTQPAVSQHVGALEKRLGARLLHRGNKSILLTKAGQIVYEHAKEILGVWTHMQRLVDDTLHRAQGNITVGASYTFGEYVLPKSIARFRKRFPDIVPSIQIGNTKDIAEAVAKRQIDVGIVEGEVHEPNLEVEAFAEDAMVVIAGTGTSECPTAPSALELEQQPWIVREPGSGTRAWEDYLFQQLQCHPRVVLEFGSTQIIKEAVEAGLGLALLSKNTLYKELQLGSLRILEVPNTPLVRPFSLVTNTALDVTKALETFVHFMKEDVAAAIV